MSNGDNNERKGLIDINQRNKDKRNQNYNIPPGGHADVSDIQEDKKGKFTVNVEEYRKGDSSDTLRIPAGTKNPQYMGGGEVKTGESLDEDTYEALTGLDKIPEDRELSKKGKKFHKKYNKKNK